jgi:hypothetical protein
LNPGPTIPLNLCTLNIRSLFAPGRAVFIPDAIDTYNIDILALSETWQNPCTTPSQLFDVTPANFPYLGQPRDNQILTDRTVRSTTIGGGLGFMVKDPLCPEPLTLPSHSSFEIFWHQYQVRLIKTCSSQRLPAA